MRHETCLTCRHVARPGLLAATLLAEMLTDQAHHHHTVICEDCHVWWFDDCVVGGLGIPVPSRRDTVMCDCPEDGASRFTQTVVLVPEPEADCHCTAELVERHAMPIRLGSRP